MHDSALQETVRGQIDAKATKDFLLRKAFNKVFPFNKVEVNEGLPSLERNGSKEGIESRVKPHGHRGEFSDLTETATDAGDDSEAESDISDVLSIFSTTNSLAPSDSSYGSMQAYHTNVAKQLVAELLKENELKSLYEVALAKFGKDFQKLEADRQYSLNQLLKLPLVGNLRETNAIKNNAKDGRDSGNTLDGNSDKSDESEDKSEEESDEESEDSLEPIDAVVAFFIRGAPFTQFKNYTNPSKEAV
ncbi:hypothetical protein V8E51_004170 [Hyaloscypha variabilis]